MSRPRCRSPYQRLIALWILRAISSSTGGSALSWKGGFAPGEVARFLDLPADPFDRRARGSDQRVRSLLAKLENSSARLSARAQRNFDGLSATLGLDGTEQRIAEFCACMKAESVLYEAWDAIRYHDRYDNTDFLSRALGLPKRAVGAALARGSRLARSGLLRISGKVRSVRNLEFVSEGLACHLLEEPYNPRKVLAGIGVRPTSPAELRPGDFPHLTDTIELLLAYLKRVRQSGRRGVNILLHGPPGTGKTQLARTLGAELGTPVFELLTSDSDDDPLKPEQRLSVLLLALNFFASKPVLLVFEEAEDILMPSFSHRGMANTHKGWFNDLLATNSQPVCWISNSVDCLDPAFARRFDFVVAMPVPPRAIRGKILRERAGDLLPETLIERLSDMDELAPAVVTRACDVVRTVRGDIPKNRRGEAFTQVISGVLRAQGHSDPLSDGSSRMLGEVFDIRHLNTTGDPRKIAALASRVGSARLCLHGPPGTGKTAFGHWLARESGRPLQIARGSDLISPAVGMTEKAIARAFMKAADDGAVLLIDEVDSFLLDRAFAKRSWEITQVNEMLTRIEEFPGILIASTNRLDHLDPASLRRFDLKLAFGYLLPGQIRALYCRWCQFLALPAPLEHDLAMAEALENVTPGDFAAVGRCHRFHPFENAAAMLRALAGECALKDRRNRRIGFQ